MEYRCNRCHSIVSFENVSQDYFAYCLVHDEDLYSFETYVGTLRLKLTTCKTCGVTQIPDTWFGECKRCYDLPE